MNLKHKRIRLQNGSLTIEERTNGKVWIFRWREPSTHGRTKQRKVTIGPVNKLTKTQAQRKAEEYRGRANAPEPLVTNGDLTVAQLVEHYTERELGDSSGKATKPRKAYLYIFANYIIPKWGTLPLKAVKAVAVEDWLKTLPLANGSKAKVREVFGAAFRHAMRYELYPINPIANVRQVRKRTIDPEILEPAEIMAIMNELEGVEPVRTAFLIAAVMGMRRGEIFGLKWADIDLERAFLHVRRSYVDGVVGPPKTESSRRPLPIPPPVVKALTAWKGKTLFSHADDWVFASEYHFGKQPLWPGTLWQRNVTPAITRAGITKPKLGWHTLRRSYASLLLSSGASLRVSMELMRHSTPEMTLGTYAQTVGDEKREAGAKVALLVLQGGNAA
ncbi:tyrosine-type recombinase/integrase [Tunturiibacter gelidiferens]|uniref:tyrosine-type recombinase/integrase n=1 Tax=Tunturiibacter gelidiferens TaxID=3069689 RepID=UPI003D9B2F23